jgi:tRNA threonylcarbamoyladenosine biosynthesis protein TsaB
LTGLRVGIAMARGISEGLQRPLVGVGSLQAMARAVPEDHPGVRCPILDARRGEVFAAAYDATGASLMAPFAAAPGAALARLLLASSSPLLLVGSGLDLLSDLEVGPAQLRGEATDLPSARFVAALALAATPERDVVPAYVRDDVAVRPRLPKNPLG